MKNAPDPLLAIESSTRRGSIALCRGDAVFTAPLARERAHASDLIPTLDTLFAKADLTPDIPSPDGAIVVGTGPGSYTGLRVGIATALGLARGTGMALRGIPSLEALAFARLQPDDEAAIVLNARASEFYYARYRRLHDDVETLQVPCVLRADELLARITDETILLADETVASAADLPPEITARLLTDVDPPAASLLDLGRNRLLALGPQDPSEVTPLYLRPFTTPSRRP